jgi:long-chain fatty acid transport protein
VDTEITGLSTPIPLDILIDTRSTTMFVPQQLVLGTAVRPLDWLRLSFDLTWADWSRHPGAGARETIVVMVDPPPSLPIDVPSEIPPKFPVSMHMRDTWSPRFGLEARPLSNDMLDLYVRGGYAFVPTGYPTQTGSVNLVDADRHIITLGLGTTLRGLRPTLPGTLSFDAYGMFTVLPRREHVKSSPVDPVGDYSAGGTQIGAGVMMELAFE